EVKRKSTLLQNNQSEVETAKIFMKAVRKYLRVSKLTPRMLGELVEKIEVEQYEKIDGKYIQRLTIHYTCIGSVELPEDVVLPKIELPVRRGISVTYAN
ncbi:MAG: DUF4368 domain-containing protein, partial [Eubacteriales bacterium]